MRKILYKKWIPIQYDETVNGLTKTIKGTGCWEDDYVNEGLFHQWANACNEGNENFGNYTVGLVELEDGSIVEVLPSNIKFIK